MPSLTFQFSFRSSLQEEKTGLGIIISCFWPNIWHSFFATFLGIVKKSLQKSNICSPRKFNVCWTFPTDLVYLLNIFYVYIHSIYIYISIIDSYDMQMFKGWAGLAVNLKGSFLHSLCKQLNGKTAKNGENVASLSKTAWINGKSGRQEGRTKKEEEHR